MQVTVPGVVLHELQLEITVLQTTQDVIVAEVETNPEAQAVQTPAEQVPQLTGQQAVFPVLAK